MKHTQGNWTYTNANNSDFFDIDCDGNRICSIDALEQDKEEAKANARLIANAPELLKALKFLLSSYKADFNTITGAPLNNTDAVIQATIAIMKAEKL